MSVFHTFGGLHIFFAVARLPSRDGRLELPSGVPHAVLWRRGGVSADCGACDWPMRYEVVVAFYC